jgi:hypothetical protein
MGRFLLTRRSALALITSTYGALSRSISAEDDAFLEDLSRRAFLLFWEQSDSQTGLALDRARNDGSRDPRVPNMATIAATGFALSALAIASARRWVPPQEAAARVRLTLRAFDNKIENHHGWFFHFLDAPTGARYGNTELSSIDTALLLAGVLTAREYFRKDSEIVRLATAIYQRVDFQWMLNGDPYLLSHGWKPESGFLPYRWDWINEATLLYALAIASPTHPIPAASWYAWKRTPLSYDGIDFVSNSALFTHQYPQAWLDLRGLRDGPPSNLNYFENSVKATEANRRFCIDLSKDFPKSYSPDIWGISASDGEKGYFAWGDPPKRDNIDGTLVPCAAAGSLMFAPSLCLPDLRLMKARFGDRIWGRYGFADAFNPTTGWVDPDVLGIDQGISLLSAENLRTGFIWKYFMRTPEIRKFLARTDFHRASVGQAILPAAAFQAASP